MSQRKEQVLVYWHELFNAKPVDWKDKTPIKEFSKLHDRYAKAYSTISMEEQGWVSEQVSKFLKSSLT